MRKVTLVRMTEKHIRELEETIREYEAMKAERMAAFTERKTEIEKELQVLRGAAGEAETTTRRRRR